MKLSLLIITALLSLPLEPTWTAELANLPPVPLKSDSKEWRFYPAAREAGKARVLLIGDSIMNAYRQRVSAVLKGRSTVDVSKALEGLAVKQVASTAAGATDTRKTIP